MRQNDASKDSEIEQQDKPSHGGKGPWQIGELFRRWPQLGIVAVLLATLAILLLGQNDLLVNTAMQLRLELTPSQGNLSVDGQTLTWPLRQSPTALLLAAPDPLTREFQIDGTDSTNNFSLDPAYLARIAGTPYYRFQMWMRDSSSYSSWRDVRLDGMAVGAQSDGSVFVTLGTTGTSKFSANLLRPETPAHLYLQCGGAVCGEIVINRNDRYVMARDLTASGASQNERRIYFPDSPWPFVAEVLYLLAQVIVWSLTLLLLALALQGMISLLAPVVTSPSSLLGAGRGRLPFAASLARVPQRAKTVMERLPGALISMAGRLVHDRWDGLALLTVLGSFVYVLWVALAQYQGQPHILDASAYLFQAKIFASGHLSAPAPANLDAFQGPFMVVRDGRWFAQYPPMTSLLLAVGVALHAPWLIEPLLGTLALLGIYRLGRRFYSGAVAWLAILLGALSPFYTYLAASYMSHTVALFFAVYFLWMLVRFVQDWRWYDLALAAVFAVGLLLTREFSAAIIGVVASAFLLGGQWRSLWQRKATLWPVFCLAISILMSGLVVYLLYNQFQTGSATVSPRTLFFPGDRYGFGQGIGFYGQHTFAAGMVVLDQLLTILLIDLYGWPFFLTLALLPLTFFRRDRGTRWDIFCALLLMALCGAQAGYFYHGIYLGPRYLFETLPFLLLLTARGVTGLAATLTNIVQGYDATRPATRLAFGVPGALLLALIACNLLYYTPRQAQIYHEYTGLPAATPVDARAIYAFHPRQAIVLTNSWYFYNYILWPLNDPALQGTTLYAYAPSADIVTRLHAAYPDRAFYMLQIAPNGTVRYVQV